MIALFGSAAVAGATPAGVVGPTAVTLAGSAGQTSVLVVNPTGAGETFSLTPDRRLGRFVTVRCPSCASVAAHSSAEITLTRVPDTSAGAGSLAVLASGDGTVLLVAVTVEAPRSPTNPALPSGITRFPESSSLCEVDPVVPPSGFRRLRASLSGPAGLAPVALVAWDTSAVDCTKVVRAFRDTGALPRAADAPKQLLLIASGLNRVGSWVATVNLDPAATDKGAITITMKRTKGPGLAWILIALGSLLASALALAAGSLLPRWQDSAAKKTIRSDAGKLGQSLLEAIRRSELITPTARHDLAQVWSEVTDTQIIGASCALAELERRKAAYGAAGAALVDLLDLIEGLGEARAETNLFAAMITAAKDAPNLTSTKAPTIVGSASDAEAWVVLLKEIDWTIANTADHAELEEMRADVLNTHMLSPLTQARLHMVKLTEIQQGAKERIVPSAADLDIDVDDAGNDDYASWGGRAQMRLVTTAGVSARLGTPQYPRRAVVDDRVVIVSAPTPENLASQARRARRLSFGAEVVVAATALALAALVAFTAQYYAADVWGTWSDQLKAFAWAFTATGGVQVAKTFAVGGSPIKIGSS